MVEIVGFDFSDLSVIEVIGYAYFGETSSCSLILILKGEFGRRHRLFYILLLIAFLADDVAKGV